MTPPAPILRKAYRPTYPTSTLMATAAATRLRGAPTIMDHRGLISSLFDFSFNSFITPKIQRFLYVLLLILAGLAGIATLVAIFGAAGGFFGKVGALIVGVPAAGILALFLAMYFRVMMEILIVVFKGVEYLAEISEQTKPKP